MTTRVAVAWSGGKDSATALARIRHDQGIAVVALFTTIDDASGLVTHHRLPIDVVREQADALALPLVEVAVPMDAGAETYGDVMREALARPELRQIGGFVFGDLFLRDLRAYRERMLASVGLRAWFPLWGSDTELLARELIRDGLRATVVSVETSLLDEAFLGRSFDSALLDDLPEGADPCGENGEFHTLVTRGPGFRIRRPTLGATCREGSVAFLEVVAGAAG